MTTTTIRCLLLSLSLVALVPAGGLAAGMDQRHGRDVARAYTDLFYSGAIEQLWPRLSPALRLQLGSAEGLRAFRRKVAAQAGRETESRKSG